jgi:hypothetical protein
MGQVSDLVSLVLFDFARSDATGGRNASKQARSRELITVFCCAPITPGESLILYKTTSRTDWNTVSISVVGRKKKLRHTTLTV